MVVGTASFQPGHLWHRWHVDSSTIFSQICNICAFLGLWIVVVRFQQIRDYGDHGKANIASVVLGSFSCAGVSILGNFQQSVLGKVHLVGALLAFLMGVGYFWVQLFLTYRAQPSHDRYWVGPSRVICCFLCTVLLIASIHPVHQKRHRIESFHFYIP